MKHIEDAFHSFALDRTISMSSQLSTTDQCSNLSRQCIEQFKAIKEHLPEHIQPTLFEYEENMNLLNGISQDFMYVQGLKDGSRLIKHLVFDE